MDLDDALGLIAEVPDFPKPGVLFRDFAPLFASADGFRVVIDALAETIEPVCELLAAVEARGFLLAAALGYRLGTGVALVRKPGKLPRVADRVEYTLEYGSATLELPSGVPAKGRKVVVIDDVLATGGTLRAARDLLERAGATVAGVSVVLELTGLGGRDRLPGTQVNALRATG